MTAIAVASIIAIDGVLSEENSFIVFATTGEWVPEGSDLRNDNSGKILVGAGTPYSGYKFQVFGPNIFTDASSSYNSAFPATDLNTYISGKNHFFRGGVPEGYGVTMQIDSVNDIVTVHGDMHFNNPSTKITSTGDICIGNCP